MSLCFDGAEIREEVKNHIKKGALDSLILLSVLSYLTQTDKQNFDWVIEGMNKKQKREEDSESTRLILEEDPGMRGVIEEAFSEVVSLAEGLREEVNNKHKGEKE